MEKRIWKYIIGIAILTIIIFYPYSFNLNDNLVNAIDPLFYAWNLDHNANFFKGYSKNIFDTNIYFPLTNTLAYSDTLWTQSIFGSPIIWLTKNPILTENLLIFLSFILSFYFMHLLALYLTKQYKASLITGLFYAFSYPRIAQLGHLPYIWSQWLPLIVLFTLKYFENGKWKNMIMAYIFYLLAASSSIYFGVFMIPLFGVFSVIKLWYWIKHEKKSILTDRTKKLLIFIIPSLIGLLITNFPYLRLKMEHPEYVRTLFVTMDLRAFPKDYINVTPASLLAKIGFPIGETEHTLYPTLTVLVLSYIGLIYLRKKDRWLFYMLISALSIYVILSFGAEQTVFGKNIRLPFYYLFSYTPLFSIVRVPARMGLFSIFILTILASYGLKKTLTDKNSFPVSCLIVCLFLFEVWQIYTPSVKIPLTDSFPNVYFWLKNQSEKHIIAELPMRLFYNGSPMKKQLMKNYDDLDEMDNYVSETYRLYFSILHRKRMVNGYSGFFPDEYNKISDAAQSFPSDYSIKILKETGVTTLILHENQFRTDFSEIEKILSDRSDIRFTAKFNSDSIYEFIK